LSKEPRILFLDLETLTDTREVLKVFPSLSDYPGRTLKAQLNSVICFGYKWLGSKTQVICAWDFKERWRKDVNDDFAVVRAALEQVWNADVIVTFNGKKFDWRFLQTRAIKHKLGPLPKLMHIDLCQESKKHLYLHTNRLGNVAEFLYGDKKLKHDGWDLWVDVHRRKAKAMRKMSEYCAKDVDLLVPIFKRMRPWLRLPNYNMYSGPKSKPVCPNCGSTRLRRHGLRVADQKIYTRYMCTDCLTTSREHKGLDRKAL